MKETIDLALIHVQESALEKEVRKAEQALVERQRQLRLFKEEVKKETVSQLASGQTTGDPFIDEIIPLLGIEKATIDKIIAFNEALVKGKEILIAVPQRVCTKHVMFPRPGCENEYVTEWGYIFGTLSGERLVFKQKATKSTPRTEITLPLKRYLTWGFENSQREDIKTPVEGPLIIDWIIFGVFDPNDLLFSVIKGNELTGMPNMSGVSLEVPKVIIDGKILGDEKNSEDGRILLALEHGRKNINFATPDEKLAGAHI